MSLSLLFSVCFSVIISKYKHQIQIFFFLDGKWVMMSLYYDDNPTVRVTLIYLLRILNISFTLLVTNLKTELGKQIIKNHSFWSKKVGWHDYYCPNCRPQQTLTFWVNETFLGTYQPNSISIDLTKTKPRLFYKLNILISLLKTIQKFQIYSKT